MIVTAVERQRRSRRVRVFVDGAFALGLSERLAEERDVRVGRALTRDELSGLASEDERRRALEAALRLLSYRPRSEREIRDRLRRSGYHEPATGEALRRLRELGYLNDATFAGYWTETRQNARPRSRRLLTSELRTWGVSREVAEEATAGLSDEEAAYRAANSRLRILGGLDHRQFRERLGAFLMRRGFSYDVARRTIERCWEELGEGQGE